MFYLAVFIKPHKIRKSADFTTVPVGDIHLEPDLGAKAVKLHYVHYTIHRCKIDGRFHGLRYGPGTGNVKAHFDPAPVGGPILFQGSEFFLLRVAVPRFDISLRSAAEQEVMWRIAEVNDSL